MADKNDDIKHLFEHLGLDPGAYQEIKGPSKVSDSAKRWTLLSDVSGKSPQAAEIPESRRQVVAEIGAAHRAQRIAALRGSAATEDTIPEESPNGSEQSAELEAPKESRRRSSTVTWAEESDQAGAVDADEPSDDAFVSSDSELESVSADDHHAADEVADQDAFAMEAEALADDSPAEALDRAADDPAPVDDPAAKPAAEAQAAARSEKREPVAATKNKVVPPPKVESAPDDVEINLLGDFADSIGGTDEGLATPPSRRPMRPVASRGASRPRDVEVGAAASSSEPSGSSSQTQSAVRNLLTATQRVKPAATGERTSPSSVRSAASTSKAPPARREPLRQEPVLDVPPAGARERTQPAPEKDRRQSSRDEFEQSIEAVAQAAKAEVRRRVEQERQQAAQRAERATEPEEQAVPTPAAKAAEPLTSPSHAPEPAATPESVAKHQAEALVARHQPQPELPEERETLAQRSAPEAEDDVESAETTSERAERIAEQARDSVKSAAAEAALPSARKAGPSPLRKLREAQSEQAEADEQEQAAAPTTALHSAFKRLQTPEKPAITASGKLRLNYGVRGGAQGVSTGEPESINQIFDRLRRNRRPRRGGN